MRLALLGLGLAGCFIKPSRPRDLGCVLDTFDGSQDPCLPWGGAYGNAFVDLSDGKLEIIPISNLGPNGGGCLSDPLAFSDGGIYIEVTEVPSSPSGSLSFGERSGHDLYMSASGGNLYLSNAAQQVLAMKPFDLGAMRWWRLRPDRTQGVVVAEYSSDADSWQRLGDDGPVVPDSIGLDIDADVEANEPNPGRALVDELDACP